MMGLQLAPPGDRLSVLCLGAHSDDIEIGAGATLLNWMDCGVCLDVRWCVLSGGTEREGEAKASATDFLSRAASATVEVMSCRDGFFPEQGEQIKSWFEMLKGRVEPDIILTHRRDDAHQDHRQLSRLTWNTFRDHCILETKSPNGTAISGNPIFTCLFRLARYNARSTC
jgi:LmbE family N-acetylglucosaminyl deacetylase